MTTESTPPTENTKASDQPIVMLLERIAIALESIAEQTQQTRKDVQPSQAVVPPKPGSEDYARCLAWAKANGAPGVRAEKAIARAGISSIKEVKYERLLNVKNCGETTIHVLLEWAASKSH